MAPIKILRVIYDLQIGGVQRMLLRMVPALQAAGFDIHVCCLREEGVLAQEFRRLGATVHLILFRSRLDPRGVLRLRGLIRHENYRIVHGHMYASNIVVNAACLLNGHRRVINSYHSQHPLRGPNQIRLTRWTRGVPDRIIAVSEAVKTPLVKFGLPEEKIRVLYNGVELPTAAAPFPAVVPGDPLRLVWAGRFVRQKRVDLLIDIVAACRAANLPISLTLVGEGPQFESLKTRVETEGLCAHVRFPGWQRDITPFVADSELYVSASDREGLSNTLLEVCAQGRGSLLADIPPNAEVIGGTGAGFLLSSRVEDWVDRLRVLHSDREAVHRMGALAFERAQQFSVERSCQQTIAVYRELLGLTRE